MSRVPAPRLGLLVCVAAVSALLGGCGALPVALAERDAWRPGEVIELGLYSRLNPRRLDPCGKPERDGNPLAVVVAYRSDYGPRNRLFPLKPGQPLQVGDQVYLHARQCGALEAERPG